MQTAGRPQPDPQVRQAANKDVAPAQRDNVKGASPDPAPPAEDQTPDPASPPAEPLVGADVPAAGAEATPAAEAAPAAEAEPAAEAAPPAEAAPARRGRSGRRSRAREAEAAAAAPRTPRRAEGQGRRARQGRARSRGPAPAETTTEDREVSNISAKDVKALRDQTGAGMMDCKRALVETDGDMDAALELLKVQLGNKLQKLAGREATEGTVQSYIHANGKVGVLVEVDCNTDFVARNDDFVAFAREVAMHIAASPDTRYVSEEEIDEDARQAELRVFEQQAADKPENVRAKIAEGKLRKWMEETVLLKQPHVNGDKYDGKTIEDLRAELSRQTGENIVVRRFTRFAVGE